MLKALSPTTQRSHNGTIMWLCKCLNCNEETVVPSTKLVAGEVRSCGCMERIREARTSRGTSGFNSLYSHYRSGARARSLSFDLSKEEFRSLVIQDCTYCGKPPQNIHYGSRGKKAEYGKFIHNGVDRVDSSENYSVSNCVPCCTECNLGKSDKSYEQFMSWISRVYTHKSLRWLLQVVTKYVGVTYQFLFLEKSAEWWILGIVQSPPINVGWSPLICQYRSEDHKTILTKKE